MKKIGLITYQHTHLKTEQVVESLIRQDLGYSYHFYALPFVNKVAKPKLITHRPDQANAINAFDLAKQYSIPYKTCVLDTDIDNNCDVYLILGAGILSKKCIEGKRIINCHPGIIPDCRGLDAFKWAIVKEKPLGVTLHYIDEKIDAGEIIKIIPTQVYLSDTLERLARRHYENEIETLANFHRYVKKENKDSGVMTLKYEMDTVTGFPAFLDKYSQRWDNLYDDIWERDLSETRIAKVEK